MRTVNQFDQRTPTITEFFDAIRLGSLSRREALLRLGGAGLTAAGLLTLGRRAALAQDGGTPPAMATPTLGQQADGSTIWHVKVGDMRMEPAPIVELHTFFPGEITIAEGDAVWFDFGMMGFHTVSFLSGAEIPPLQIPDPDGGTHAADGSPKMVLNLDVGFQQGGETYDGTGYVNSGIDAFRDPTVPYVLTFTAAGTYEYLCVIHALVMKGTVVVEPAGTALPQTQAEYDQASADEMAALYAQGDAEIATYAEAGSTQNADGTTTWEATVGAGGETHVRVMAFLPVELEITVGDTVRWTHRSFGEPHTVSFIGAGETVPEDFIVEQFADGSPKFVQSPLTFLPQGGDVWSGTGWVNSGFMGFIPGMPTEYALTFDTPGEYIYFCVLHGDAEGNRMAARVTVSAP